MDDSCGPSLGRFQGANGLVVPGLVLSPEGGPAAQHKVIPANLTLVNNGIPDGVVKVVGSDWEALAPRQEGRLYGGGQYGRS